MRCELCLASRETATATDTIMETLVKLLILALVLIFIAAMFWPVSREGFTGGSPDEIYKGSKPLYDETNGNAPFSAFKAAVEPVLSDGRVVDADIHLRTRDLYRENPAAYSPQAIAGLMR